MRMRRKRRWLGLVLGIGGEKSWKNFCLTFSRQSAAATASPSSPVSSWSRRRGWRASLLRCHCCCRYCHHSHHFRCWCWWWCPGHCWLASALPPPASTARVWCCLSCRLRFHFRFHLIHCSSSDCTADFAPSRGASWCWSTAAAAAAETADAAVAAVPGAAGGHCWRGWRRRWLRWRRLKRRSLPPQQPWSSPGWADFARRGPAWLRPLLRPLCWSADCSRTCWRRRWRRRERIERWLPSPTRLRSPEGLKLGRRVSWRRPLRRRRTAAADGAGCCGDCFQSFHWTLWAGRRRGCRRARWRRRRLLPRRPLQPPLRRLASSPGSRLMSGGGGDEGDGPGGDRGDRPGSDGSAGVRRRRWCPFCWSCGWSCDFHHHLHWSLVWACDEVGTCSRGVLFLFVRED